MKIHDVKYHQSEELSVERSQGNLGSEKPPDHGGFVFTDWRRIRTRIISLLIQVNYLVPKGVVLQELKLSSFPASLYLETFPCACLNLQ